MKTSRISLFVSAAAIFVFACSSGLAQQFDVPKHRHSSSSEIYAPGHSSHLPGNLYSSMLAHFMRDPSNFDFVSVRRGPVGFAAPRLAATSQFAGHRLGGSNTLETPDIFQEASFASPESGFANTFGSFDAFGSGQTTFGSFSRDALCAGVGITDLGIACGGTPEPSTWFAAALAVAVVAYSQRRRLFRLRRA